MEQEEEDVADPLVSKGMHPMDLLKDVKVSFTLNLFPGGFSIEGQNEAHPYDRAYKDFLHCIDTGVVPAEALLDLSGHVDFTYYDGCLVVEIRDHRFPRQLDLKPEVHRVLLHPDNQTVTSDLRSIWRRFQNLSTDDILMIERHMLLAMQPQLCLDPSPDVARVASHVLRAQKRMQVWHPRPSRPAKSGFRRNFDEGALKKMHATAHAFRRDPDAMVKLERLARQRASTGMHPPQSLIKGFPFNQKTLDMVDADEKTAMRTAAIMRVFYNDENRTTSSHPSQREDKPGSGKARPPKSAQGQPHAGAQIPMYAFLPIKFLKPHVPPERQLRFRKDPLCASLWIQSKSPSSYQAWTRIDEVGKDGKQIEGSQMNVPTVQVGLSNHSTFTPPSSLSTSTPLFIGTAAREEHIPLHRKHVYHGC